MVRYVKFYGYCPFVRLLARAHGAARRLVTVPRGGYFTEAHEDAELAQDVLRDALAGLAVEKFL